MTEEYMCYIGRKACGCIVFAVMDDPAHKRDVARELGKAVRDGLSIERVTAQYVRDNFSCCEYEVLEASETEKIE